MGWAARAMHAMRSRGKMLQRNNSNEVLLLLLPLSARRDSL